jgi:nitroimidazol reductase NimA-like FMN-containing flavoprotein (pyridoxamine 5'-phosphate oxidase superfamily)
MIRPVNELTRTEIDELLRTQTVGRVGCHADGTTYVVPVIFGWDGESVYVLTVEGLKTRMLRANPSVCFEVDAYEGPGVWRSAILQGDYEELEGEEVERALGLLRERFGGTSRRPRESGRQAVAFRINVREATGRSVG